MTKERKSNFYSASKKPLQEKKFLEIKNEKWWWWTRKEKTLKRKVFSGSEKKKINFSISSFFGSLGLKKLWKTIDDAKRKSIDK